jgi:UPF0716 protein FxsA
MLGYLFLLFTIVPILELTFIIQVGREIGPLNTIALLIVIGIAGAYLARIQGFQVLRNVQESLEKGIIPTEAMLDGFLILCGGILLLTPGFLTDIIGLVFLIPPTRALLKIFCKKQMKGMAQKGKMVTFGTSPKQKKRGFENFEDADFS